MIIYLLNIVILTIAYISSREKEVRYAKDKYCSGNLFFCIIASLNWILLSGLRHISIGADTEAYKNMYEQIANTSWTNILNMFKQRYIQNMISTKDPGYSLIEKCFQQISLNYRIWLIAIAILFFASMGIWLYRYSSNIYFSYILFSCLFYSFFAITGHRQTIATALVVMIGTQLIEKRKLIPFLILIVIAYTIHASAICFLPFYWLSRIPINKVTLRIYWIVIVIAFIGRYRFLNMLQLIVGYDNYRQDESARVGIFLYLLVGVALILTIFYDYFEHNSKMIMCINALMISCFFSSLLLISPAMMRVVQYYSVFLMILLPEFLKIVKREQQKMTLVIIVGVLCILLIRNNPTYRFFWQ